MTEKSDRFARAERKLLETVELIELPPHMYEDAAKHYGAVGDWLNDPLSPLARFEPQIYPQGSFLLGTAIRPPDDCHYDVDAVCLLELAEADLSQHTLKDMVGTRLRQHGTYAGMLDPPEGGRRCWTLKYADASKFHLDILPAIPDDTTWLTNLGVPALWAESSICITDKTTWGVLSPWPRSNPKGYAEWFKNRMRPALEEQRRVVAGQIHGSVEQVPDHKVRTPLQRLVQLLKRHRDIRYGDDPDRPISIIISTLAASGYNNERGLLEALLAVVPAMRRNVERRDGVYWVPNPVNPAENFADRWEESPRKAAVFFEWLDVVEQEHAELLSQVGDQQLNGRLGEAYGVALPVSDTRPVRAPLLLSASRPIPDPPDRFNVPHRELPPWPLALSTTVRIKAEYGHSSRQRSFASGEGPLPKRASLRFRAETLAAEPFSVHWQVVNTGEQARVAGNLRGSIFPAAEHGWSGLVHHESTLYTGSHWVECFLVKNGRCVARSGEFVVSVA